MRFLCNLLILFLSFSSFAAKQNIEQTAVSTRQLSENKYSYLSANSIKYNHSKQQIKAIGNVKVVYDNYYLKADKLVYNLKDDLLWSEGNVDITDNSGQQISAKEIILTKNLKIGVIESLAYRFSDDSLLGAALAKRLDENRLSLENTVYSPCQLGCSGLPLWQIRSGSSLAEFDKHQITHKKVFFEIWGWPILYLPYFSHPMPKSPAKSGLLVPSLDQGSVKIPVYFRLKPNYDLTVSPRLDTKSTLLETEFRHKLQQGEYTVNFNYTRLPIIIQKKQLNNRYYFNSVGNFRISQNHYGFIVNQTSDKSFLKEYYNEYDSYLYSKFFYNRLNQYDFISAESLYFENLKIVDSSRKDQLILPKIHTRNILDVNFASSELAVENNLLSYFDRNSNNLYQGSSEISISQDFINNYGILNSITTRVRTDLYYLKSVNSYIEKYKKTNKNSAMVRLIPEFESLFRLPLTNDSGIIIEPILMVVIGRNSQKKDKKFQLIDANNYVLNDTNLFVANRYNGIDKHQFGQRINYGFNVATQIEDNYYNFSFGKYQSMSEYDPNNNNCTGKAQVIFPNQISAFYKFTTDSILKPKWSEVGLNFQSKYVDVGVSYISIINSNQKKLKQLLLIDDDSLKLKSNQSIDLSNKKYTQQMIFSANFRLNDQWSFGNETSIDLSKKSQMLYRNFKVTYLGECASIALKFYDDNLVDQDRNIKASKKFPSISLGLKTINF